MKTLSELAKEVYNARSLPGVLADLHIELASIYSNMNDGMMETQLKKADFWQVKDYDIDFSDAYAWKEVLLNATGKREKPLSDKQVEMMWLQTEDGRKEIKYKYALRSLEKLMSAVKSSLVNAAIEARNL